MNSPEINRAILSGTFTNTELSSIIQAVKYARSSLGHTVAQSLKPGVTVKFTGRSGPLTGVVQKIAIKNATVSTPAGLYRVPMNMLETV
jgi:hypothetical protein